MGLCHRWNFWSGNFRFKLCLTELKDAKNVNLNVDEGRRTLNESTVDATVLTTDWCAGKESLKLIHVCWVLRFCRALFFFRFTAKMTERCNVTDSVAPNYSWSVFLIADRVIRTKNSVAFKTEHTKRCCQRTLDISTYAVSVVLVGYSFIIVLCFCFLWDLVQCVAALLKVLEWSIGVKCSLIQIINESVLT